MTITVAPAILAVDINELEMSEEFKAASRQMGFGTLQEIIATDAAELFRKDGFNYNWFGELIRYLTEKGLANLLQPLPGRNPD
ncbi:hypothetical protein LX99_04241 [Mucilaginibacter oryzae]|uniref:Uncharacterized protein n=1 Tax=Mucilaginibacter oryzae TaxID=468058 RepID=A0A316H2E2_9SPHI|nr:hypothetical protein [Mucilaginibacter oryzae]PWK72911.1 hypothetical protein LX99_04241 [Mucilaginibacter oryzae]